MAKINKSIIDTILEQAKIEEVVLDCLGAYSPANKTGLKKRGIRYEALCPFHDDKSLGSFVIYPKGNCFKCFSCGAKGGVVDFLMEYEHLSYPDAIRWLGKKYGIEVDNVAVDWTPPPPRPAPPPLPMLQLPIQMVKRCEEAIEIDTLARWIRTGINWDTVQRKRIDQMLRCYHVGHGRNGHTIFWQIDERGIVHTGKMMKYREDGHRDKEASWNFDWIHSSLFRTPTLPQYDEDKMEAKASFFGLHLLNAFGKHATINLVESEKTALLMAIAYGNNASQVWMACGGLEMISRERLQPIIDAKRRIILYPDRDGIEKWRIKAEQMHYDRMTINAKPVTEWWKPQDGEKADIADVVIRYINESEPLTTIADVEREMPAAKPLIDKLNLEIDNDDQERHSTE